MSKTRQRNLGYGGLPAVRAHDKLTEEFQLPIGDAESMVEKVVSGASALWNARLREFSSDRLARPLTGAK